MQIYKGYDIIHDEDGCGYYAQDFNHPKQPTSSLYDSVEEVKAAIDNHEIAFQYKKRREIRQ